MTIYTVQRNVVLEIEQLLSVEKNAELLACWMEDNHATELASIIVLKLPQKIFLRKLSEYQVSYGTCLLHDNIYGLLFSWFRSVFWR